MNDTTNPAEIFAGIERELVPMFEQMNIADDEIERAAKEHPEHADVLFHSFGLLTPTHPLMTTEMVYRGHCRELLARVVAGADTRPGTAAEICCACCEASQVAPMTTAATGLYMRAWASAFPDNPVDAFADDAYHYEAIRGDEIDRLESQSRRKLTRPERTLKGVTCKGMHHGEPTSCRFAPAQPMLPLGDE